MDYQQPNFVSSLQPKRRIPSWVWIAGMCVGGMALVSILACGGALVWLFRTPQASAAAKEPFEIASVPIPVFPERGPLQETEPGVLKCEISLGPSGGFYPTPGHGGVLWLYLPAGEHAPKSLPCVLITGAGSNLLTGMSLSEGDEDEQCPYARAGFAVVAYELDGFDSELEDDPQSLKKSYQAFRESRAGLVNARNALEFVLARIPEVDPARIYSAGHSSAGTMSLLFAEHEPRLAGCIAYAPVYDVTKHLSPVGLRTMSLILPGLVDFAVQSSPATHREHLKCPVFLFHAEDDSVCEIEDSRAFESQLKQRGKNVTLETVPDGDHYDSMIDKGIPKAIEWLKRNGAPHNPRSVIGNH